MAVVGVDEQRVFAQVHIVFHPGLPRLDQQRLGQRIGGGDQPDLAGFMVRRTDDQPLFVGGERGPDAEAFVVLVVQLDIAVQRLAQPVQPRIVGAPLFVGEAVDQPPVTSDPDQPGQRTGNLVGQHFASGKVLDPRSEAFGAVVIDRPGQHGPVLRDRQRAEPEVFLALGQRDLVEDQLIRPACHGPPPPLLVFRALLEFDPVEVVAILLRHRFVRFLDPRAHLGEQAVDQRLLRRHPRLEPGVFRLEVGKDLRILDLRIKGVAQPGVVIGHGDTVMGFDVRHFLGDGGCGQGHVPALWCRHCPRKQDSI